MNNKIQYKVVVQKSVSGLQNEVNKLLDEGWKPKGSHQVVIKDEHDTYAGNQHRAVVRKYEYSQTMIKK